MNPTSLLLNNKPFSYEHIRNGKWVSSTPFEYRTLTFCQQWLSGQEVFEQQTSGSTGKPKPIKITRVQMQLSALNTVKALNIKPNNIALVCIDTAYIGGKMMLVRGFEHKLQLIIQQPSSNPLKNIDSRIDFVAMVPMQFANSYETHLNKINNCKAIILGGAPVSVQLQAKIASIKTPIYSTFGMTETVSHIALKRLSKPPSENFSAIGKLTFKTTPNGQLIINGAITQHQDLITNDQVELLSNTKFKWLGRTDNVVNSGGVKIQLEEVERIIETYFNKTNISNRFFLYGAPDNYLGQKLVLCIESNNVIIRINTLNFSSIGIEKLSCPKEVIYINRFIETSSGKINRIESFTNPLE